MGGEGAVDLGVQQNVAPRKAGREGAQHRTRGAVAGIPRHGKIAGAGVAQQARDVVGSEVHLCHAACARRERAGGGDPGQFQDVVAIEGPPPEHHLDAVVRGWIVGARDHQAAVALALVDGEIEHRRRADADAQRRRAAAAQPRD